MDNKLKTTLSIVVGGYLFSLGFYFIWCFYFFSESMHKNDYLFVIAVVVFAITAVYFFPFLLVLFIKSLQKVWTIFSIVSIITLMIFFLIPLANSEIYHKYKYVKLNLTQNEMTKTNNKTNKKNEPEKRIPVVNIKEIKAPVENDEIKMLAEEKGKEAIAEEYNVETAMDVSAKKLITELRSALKSERKKNAELRKQLNDINGKSKPSKEKLTANEIAAAPTKSNKNFSETIEVSKTKKVQSDTKNKEIVFKVQIISSKTRLKTNSLQFKNLKNIWEYKDNGLYKYTTGNQLNLKAAVELQTEFRKKGFVGAFVVAFRNGKRIPMKEAMEIYKKTQRNS